MTTITVKVSYNGGKWKAEASAPRTYGCSTMSHIWDAIDGASGGLRNRFPDHNLVIEIADCDLEELVEHPGHISQDYVKTVGSSRDPIPGE